MNFSAPNFFRNQVRDPQDFPLRPLVGIDNPFLLVSWPLIRWIFAWKIFLLELVRGKAEKMGSNLVENVTCMVQMRFCFAVYTFTIHSNYLQFGYQKNGSLEDQKSSPNVG